MQEQKYVSDEAAERARDWERRFQHLHPSSGILFVSVAPEAAFRGRCSVYYVRIGISHCFEEATGRALIHHVLAEEIESGEYKILAIVFCGVSGPSRSEDHEGPHTH